MPKIVVYIISICSESTYPFFSNEMFMYREQIFMYTGTYKLEYTRKSYHFIDESSYNTHNYCCYEFHKMIPFWYVNTLKLKFSLVNVCLCWIYLIPYNTSVTLASTTTKCWKNRVIFHRFSLCDFSVYDSTESIFHRSHRELHQVALMVIYLKVGNMFIMLFRFMGESLRREVNAFSQACSSIPYLIQIQE